MQALFPEIQKFFKSFHPIIKKIVYWGVLLVCTLSSAGVACYLFAGLVGDFDKMLRLSAEFFLCAGDMLSAVGVGALFVQLLVFAYTHDYGEPPF